MGTAYGKIVNAFVTETEEYKNERLQWAGPHKLNINAARATEYKALISTHFPVGTKVELCARSCSKLGVEYQHYYIETESHPEWVIQFGGGSLTNAIVEVLPKCALGGYTEQTFVVTPAIFKRMKAVVGSTAYSLVLRNCEHVARYIHSGAWICLQMTTGEEGIGAAFRKTLMLNKDNARKLNQLPDELNPDQGTDYLEQVPGMRPLFDFETREPLGPRYDNNDYNIVVLGPTGCGKSLFINRLFNRQLCAHGGGAASVTKQFQTFSGVATINRQRRRVNVVDSIGFCDSSISPKSVCRLVKDFMRTNIAYIDMLVILVSGRIEHIHAESIRDILGWLRFQKLAPCERGNYLFLYNKADLLNSDARQAGVAYMISQLQTGNSYLICDPDDPEPTKFLCNRSLGIPLTASASVTRSALDNLLLLSPVVIGGKEHRIRVEPKTMCNIL